MAENQNVSKSAEKLVGSDVWGVTYVQEKVSGILGPKVEVSEPRPLFLRVVVEKFEGEFPRLAVLVAWRPWGIVAGAVFRLVVWQRGCPGLETTRYGAPRLRGTGKLLASMAICSCQTNKPPGQAASVRQGTAADCEFSGHHFLFPPNQWPHAAQKPTAAMVVQR